MFAMSSFPFSPCSVWVQSSDQSFAEVQCVWNFGNQNFFPYADDKESSSKERLLATEWTHSLESPQLTKLDKKSNIMKCELKKFILNFEMFCKRALPTSRDKDYFTVGDGSLSKEKWVKEFLSVLKNFARLHVLILFTLNARANKRNNSQTFELHCRCCFRLLVSNALVWSLRLLRYQVFFCENFQPSQTTTWF